MTPSSSSTATSASTSTTAVSSSASTTATHASGAAASASADRLPDSVVDVAVIGGGAAGLSGALMLARSRRSVVVLDSGTPRNAPAEGIHGLLGNEGTPPSQYLERGRGEVRQYGGLVVTGEVVSARGVDPSTDGDLRFEVALADGRTLTARRLLIATGLRDVLPEIPGLAAHWGRDLVHCPFCHGWEVRDRAIGVIATRPASFHQALMFRPLTEDLTVFAGGVEVDPGTRERFEALGITLVDTPVQEIVAGEDGGIAGVRLEGGELVPRSVLAVASVLAPRLEGLEQLGLELEDLPGGMGRQIVAGFAGASEIPGVWVAGNAAEPMAQVGTSASGGALAGANIHGTLVMADADAAVAAARGRRAA